MQLESSRGASSSEESSSRLRQVPDAWMRCWNPTTGYPVKKEPSLVKPLACSSNRAIGTWADRQQAMAVSSFSRCSLRRAGRDQAQRRLRVEA
ncbi:hypothetical protein PR202_gb12371 [Eleusine coracana subsp. coracana]|uniref:Uncharacterized protein n=1 Tax=Eleusine coracana subsp. coracana TaxID=191504 RepID=A0AAV5EPE3_ELECO|nr:hypothetical protein PR202_gb12371 [Eleusine coracana subsp. coracana]